MFRRHRCGDHSSAKRSKACVTSCTRTRYIWLITMTTVTYDLQRLCHVTVALLGCWIVFSRAKLEDVQNGGQERENITENEEQYYEWSVWSPCSRTCGIGIRFRGQRCLRETKKLCRLRPREYQTCNTQACPPGGIDFRNEQCGIYNGRDIFINGERATWMSYIRDNNRCLLFCYPYGEELFYYFGRARDGTQCSKEPYGVCIFGQCKPVGCDNVLQSGVYRDKCRVCGGNSTTCEPVSGSVKRAPTQFERISGYAEVLVLPKGSTSVTLTDDSWNYLAIRRQNGEYAINGNRIVNWPSLFKIGGMEVEYKRESDNIRETLRILGPTTEDLIVKSLLIVNEVNVTFEYWKPIRADKVVRDDPEVELLRHNIRQLPSMGWGKWTACSTSCGGGIRVRARHCGTYSMLPCANGKTEVEDCNKHPCTEMKGEWSKWGSWNACSASCGGGARVRFRFCREPRSSVKTSCAGERFEVELCNITKCPEKETARSTAHGVVKTRTETVSTLKLVTDKSERPEPPSHTPLAYSSNNNITKGSSYESLQVSSSAPVDIGMTNEAPKFSPFEISPEMRHTHEKLLLKSSSSVAELDETRVLTASSPLLSSAEASLKKIQTFSRSLYASFASWSSTPLLVTGPIFSETVITSQTSVLLAGPAKQASIFSSIKRTLHLKDSSSHLQIDGDLSKSGILNLTARGTHEITPTPAEGGVTASEAAVLGYHDQSDENLRIIRTVTSPSLRSSIVSSNQDARFFEIPESTRRRKNHSQIQETTPTSVTLSNTKLLKAIPPLITSLKASEQRTKRLSSSLANFGVIETKESSLSTSESRASTLMSLENFSSKRDITTQSSPVAVVNNMTRVSTFSEILSSSSTSKDSGKWIRSSIPISKSTSRTESIQTIARVRSVSVEGVTESTNFAKMVNITLTKNQTQDFTASFRSELIESKRSLVESGFSVKIMVNKGQASILHSKSSDLHFAHLYQTVKVTPIAAPSRTENSSAQDSLAYLSDLMKVQMETRQATETRQIFTTSFEVHRQSEVKLQTVTTRLGPSTSQRRITSFGTKVSPATESATSVFRVKESDFVPWLYASSSPSMSHEIDVKKDASESQSKRVTGIQTPLAHLGNSSSSADNSIRVAVRFLSSTFQAQYTDNTSSAIRFVSRHISPSLVARTTFYTMMVSMQRPETLTVKGSASLLSVLEGVDHTSELHPWQKSTSQKRMPSSPSSTTLMDSLFAEEHPITRTQAPILGSTLSSENPSWFVSRSTDTSVAPVGFMVNSTVAITPSTASSSRQLYSLPTRSLSRGMVMLTAIPTLEIRKSSSNRISTGNIRLTSTIQHDYTKTKQSPSTTPVSDLPLKSSEFLKTTSLESRSVQGQILTPEVVGRSRIETTKISVVSVSTTTVLVIPSRSTILPEENCSPCKMLTKRFKGYRTNDFVIHATILSEAINESTYDASYRVKVIHTFKTSNERRPFEKVWILNNVCSCPELIPNKEYVLMGRMTNVTGSDEQIAVINRQSYVQEWRTSMFQRMVELGNRCAPRPTTDSTTVATKEISHTEWSTSVQTAVGSKTAEVANISGTFPPTKKPTVKCRRCRISKKRNKKYCTSDYVIHAKVLQVVFNDTSQESKYTVKINNIFKNSVFLNDQEVLWVMDDLCRCPVLDVEEEYLIMGILETLSKPSAKLIIPPRPYVSKWKSRMFGRLNSLRGSCDGE